MLAVLTSPHNFPVLSKETPGLGSALPVSVNSHVDHKKEAITVSSWTQKTGTEMGGFPKVTQQQVTEPPKPVDDILLLIMTKLPLLVATSSVNLPPVPSPAFPKWS